MRLPEIDFDLVSEDLTRNDLDGRLYLVHTSSNLAYILLIHKKYVDFHFSYIWYVMKHMFKPTLVIF